MTDTAPEVKVDDKTLTDLECSDSTPTTAELAALISSVKKELTELRDSQKSLTEKVERLRAFEAETRWRDAKRGVYPAPPRDGTVFDEYKSASSGETVRLADPFRPLEEPDADVTREWVDAQCALLEGYYAECKDRSAIEKRVEELINFERITCPYRRGDRVFFRHNTGLQNQSVLYVCEGGKLDLSSKRMLIDPNTLSEDGTTQLKSCHMSDDGKFMCYSVSPSGADWTEHRVMDIDTGETLPEVLKWTKFTSVSWMKDISGFFYNRYADQKEKSKASGKADAEKDDSKADGDDASDKDDKSGEKEDNLADRGTETGKLSNQQLYFHRLNTPQSEDVFLTDATTLGDADWFVSASVVDDGTYLQVTLSPDCDPVNRVFLIPLADLDMGNKEADHRANFADNFKKLIDDFEHGYDYITNKGATFWFLTNHKANKYRVVSVDVSKASYPADKESDFAEVIAETESRLTYASCANGKILANYLEDAKDVICLFEMDGKPTAGDAIMKSLPPAGAIAWSSRHDSPHGFLLFESFCVAPQVYTYNFETHECELVWEVSLPGFEKSLSELFDTRQVFVTSKDGTKVPMFVMSRKGCKLDGTNPTIMYGYGGFDISLLPYFSVKRLTWLNHFGGVYAVANLRGGGEYGESWHKSGTKDKKQNVFDDFAACGEWLISEKFTCAEKLSIEGGSNGGLLVAASCNQRPDLFRAGIAQVGVLDMLRFHKFTIGYAWCSDYGNADEDGFDYLYKYSPLHNVKALKTCAVQYPAFMATCADHDDRVVPLHSYKFVAELQTQLGGRSRQTNPLLIRVEVKAGHGGSSLRKSIELIRDSFTFLQKELGATWTA
jgi:prolyl oligopeptidase